MKKLLVPLLLILAACAGDVPEAESTTVLGDPDPMAQACASDYTRIQPRLCYLSSEFNTQSASNLTIDSTWRSLDLTVINYPVPSSAKAVLIHIRPTIVSTNSVGLRQLSVNTSSSVTGTPRTKMTTFSIREQTAVVAGTTLYNSPMECFIPVVNAILYYVGINTSGNNTAQIVVVGYYD